MARTQEIYISTTYGYLHVIDKEGTDILNDKFGGLGEWSFSIAGSSTLSSADCRMKLVHDPSATEFGYAAFTALDVLNRDGVDILSGLTGWGDVLDEIAVYLFVDGVGNPNGLATSVKQDAQIAQIGEVHASPTANTLLDRVKTTNDRIGALSSPAAGSVNANLQPLQKDYAGLFIDLDSGTILLLGFFVRSTTTGASTGITYVRQDTFAPFTPPAGARQLEIENATYISQIRDRLSSSSLTITQLTTTGDGDVYNAENKSAGTFIFNFVKNGGMSAIIALYGSNDGSVWYKIAETAALSADSIGVLSWSVPYLQLRPTFTQTGAGSTLDGTFFGK